MHMVPVFKTPPEFNEKTPKRGKKERKMWGEKEKKERNFGLSGGGRSRGGWSGGGRSRGGRRGSWRVVLRTGVREKTKEKKKKEEKERKEVCVEREPRTAPMGHPDFVEEFLAWKELLFERIPAMEDLQSAWCEVRSPRAGPAPVTTPTRGDFLR